MIKASATLLVITSSSSCDISASYCSRHILFFFLPPKAAKNIRTAVNPQKRELCKIPKTKQKKYIPHASFFRHPNLCCWPVSSFFFTDGPADFHVAHSSSFRRATFFFRLLFYRDGHVGVSLDEYTMPALAFSDVRHKVDGHSLGFRRRNRFLFL